MCNLINTHTHTHRVNERVSTRVYDMPISTEASNTTIRQYGSGEGSGGRWRFTEDPFVESFNGFSKHKLLIPHPPTPIGREPKPVRSA